MTISAVQTSTQQPLRGPRKASRCAALLAALAAIVSGAQLASPSPAAAISGVDRYAETSDKNSYEPRKSADAECPAGKHVVGGGASVSEDGHRVRLTALQPYSYTPDVDALETLDGFRAEAEAPRLRKDFEWSVTAYAICADKAALPGHQIRSEPPVVSSKAFQTATARCPIGTVAFGSGARAGATPNPLAGNAQGEIGLQLNRTSGPLDISRASARESAAGFPGQWGLVSYAICAQPRGNIHFEGTIAPGATATNTCNGGLTHGPGGGGGLTDGGPVWLRRIEPSLDHKTVSVALTGSLAPSIGGVVAHQTCAL